jgi:DNA-binding NarL/FixJ family response regulator
MADSPDIDDFARALGALEGPLLDALSDIPAAIWIADPLGRIRWLNVAATALVAARPGTHFSRYVSDDAVADARELFARTIHGGLGSSVQEVTLVAVAGPVAAELISVPLRDDARVVGVVTLVRALDERPDEWRRTMPRLTPRQHQVLEHLGNGRSTQEIAQALQVSEDTVRNHVRFLLAELGVRTRLEAVVIAFRNGWL